jgi:hypothetical protein
MSKGKGDAARNCEKEEVRASEQCDAGGERARSPGEGQRADGRLRAAVEVNAFQSETSSSSSAE